MSFIYRNECLYIVKKKLANQFFCYNHLLFILTSLKNLSLVNEFVQRITNKSSNSLCVTLVVYIKPFIEGFIWEVEFCHSLISDLANDHKARLYDFIDDLNYYSSNYQHIIDKEILASYKTNFTVIGDSETGYEVCDVIMFYVDHRSC